jgi:isocitrate dehydrogenase kinase/phosphatase
MVIGILVGVVGMVLVALAYPLYNRVLKKNRDKIAPEILRLSDELLK